MTAATPSVESAPQSIREKRAAQQDVWRRYSQFGPGSAFENNLVEQYLPLVKTAVGRLAISLPAHVSHDDLYSAGLVGLLNAIRRFDSNGGSSFESYARVRIRGAIFDELRRMDWVPRSVHDKAKKVERAILEFTQRTGEIPTDAEVGRALNLSEDGYHELLEEIRPASYVCLDSVQSDGEPGFDSYDVVSDESQVNPGIGASLRELAGLIEERLKKLPDMQRKVLALYYFEDLRLREIAEAFGVTESRICQIHSQAILAIKSVLLKQDPEVFSHPL
ncbi:MAG TPA: FliA/WhiG family RNA polymerase sigma factor [Verrucomicrobiae bacterium]|nr:FliA/WhiG family RNA polymerase sigma factor [Verrucomicrobiae bacterium]